MKQIQTRESCERLARAICMDLKLYNEKEVLHVKRGLPVPAALVDAIEDGKELYLSRTAPEFHSLFDEMLVDMVGIDPSGWSAAPDTAHSVSEKSYTSPPSKEYRRRTYANEKAGFPKSIVVLAALAIVVVVVYFLVVK